MRLIVKILLIFLTVFMCVSLTQTHSIDEPYYELPNYIVFSYIYSKHISLDHVVIEEDGYERYESIKVANFVEYYCNSEVLIVHESVHYKLQRYWIYYLNNFPYSVDCKEREEELAGIAKEEYIQWAQISKVLEY